MAEGEKIQIDKLNGSNWTVWKFQMKAILRGRELWGVVSGTETLPGDATEAARRTHQLKLDKAFAIVVTAISTSQIYLVTSCDSPKGVWDTLMGHFERSTVANKFFLKRQYFQSRMEEGVAMEEHLKCLKELTDQLAALQAPIAEEDQIVVLLGSLPRSYSALVTALETRNVGVADGAGGLTLANVQQAVLHEERKQEEDLGHSDSALVGASRGQSSQKFKKGWKCFNCGKTGHFQRDCPKQEDSDRGGGQHTGKVASDDQDKEEGVGFAVYDALKTGKTQSPGTWVIDSGASNHMTWDRSLLQDYRSFSKAEDVRLGDNTSLQVLGSGTVVMYCNSDTGVRECTLSGVLYVPKLAVNLFSVRAADRKGNKVQMKDSQVQIISCKGVPVAKGCLKGKLYYLSCNEQRTDVCVAKEGGQECLQVWHQRLGHVGLDRTQKAVKEQKVEGSLRKLEWVHSDTCGPMQNEFSFGGQKKEIQIGLGEGEEVDGEQEENQDEQEDGNAVEDGQQPEEPEQPGPVNPEIRHRHESPRRAHSPPRPGMVKVKDKGQSIKPTFGEEFGYSGEENCHSALLVGTHWIHEPKSMKEALESSHAKEWKEAADSEYQSLLDNQTWQLVKETQKKCKEWINHERELRMTMEAHEDVLKSLQDMGSKMADSLEASAIDCEELNKRLEMLNGKSMQLSTLAISVRDRLESAQEQWEKLMGNLCMLSGSAVSWLSKKKPWPNKNLCMLSGSANSWLSKKKPWPNKSSKSTENS